VTLIVSALLWPLQYESFSSIYAGTEEDLIGILEQELALTNKDLSETKKEVLEIKEIVLEIRNILTPLIKRKPPEPVFVTVSIDDDPFLGDKSAPIVLVEFSDFQCIFCEDFANTILPVLKDEYITTGILKYVYRDFPLNMHKDAQKAAEAAQCAYDQDKYWEIHDLIYANQQNVDITSLSDYAEEVGVDIDIFNECLDKGTYAAEISNDINDGEEIGVRGTPTFILGKPNPDGTINGQLIAGSIPESVFKSMIDSMLKKKD